MVAWIDSVNAADQGGGSCSGTVEQNSSDCVTTQAHTLVTVHIQYTAV